MNCEVLLINLYNRGLKHIRRTSIFVVKTFKRNFSKKKPNNIQTLVLIKEYKWQ